MFDKNRKRIFLGLAIVLVVAVLGVVVCNSPRRLPKWEKEKVEKAYFEEWLGGTSQASDNSLLWYDEGVDVEDLEFGQVVWRYIGRYGDCYALLVIGEDYSRVFLYHTQKSFPNEEVTGRDYIDTQCRLYEIAAIKNREEWITDAQLERLARDVEKIARESN